MSKDTKIKKITFLKDYRTLKAGDIIEFDSNFVVLVGVNGCGKSSVLDCIREEFKIKDRSLFKKDIPAGTYEIEKSEKEFKTKYYDFHSDDKKFSSTFGDDMMGQIAALNNSSGIGSLLQFHNSGIKDMTDGLVILDEPERGMALKIQKKFSDMFLQMVMLGGNQVIVSTHSRYTMDTAELFGRIYSVEHKRFFDTADEFVTEHLK